ERSRAAALVAYDSIAEALERAAALRDAGIGLEAAEFMLPGAVRLVCEALDLPAPPGAADFSRAERDKGRPQAPALVLFEARARERALDRLVAGLREHGGAAAEDAALAEGGEGERLWRYREGLGEALVRRAPVVKLDVSLPPATLAAAVEAIERAALEA